MSTGRSCLDSQPGGLVARQLLQGWAPEEMGTASVTCPRVASPPVAPPSFPAEAAAATCNQAKPGPGPPAPHTTPVHTPVCQVTCRGHGHPCRCCIPAASTVHMHLLLLPAHLRMHQLLPSVSPLLSSTGPVGFIRQIQLQG